VKFENRKRSELTPKQRSKFKNFYLKVGKVNYFIMKKLFLSVVLLLTVSFAFANNDAETVSTFDVVETVELTNSMELSYEYKIVNIDGNAVDSCYVRVCWGNETSRRCTDWQEVPCEKQLQLEVDRY
jgi:hypothetical protein